MPLRRLALGLVAILLAYPGGSRAFASAAAHPVATADSAPAASTALAPVVVVGRFAGPKLWKVSRDGHVLWILGTVMPLPKRMVWQSDGVQTLLEHTQEVIPAWPSVGIGFHPFTLVHLYVLWRRAQDNPDHLPLRSVLPAPLYARFEALKQRFAPRDARIEQLRPILAARRLYDEALAGSDLTARDEIQQTVLRLAYREHVPVHRDKLRVQDPVQVMKDLARIPRAGEIACLESVVTRLETDLGPMQARARAWALGDVALLRRLPHVDNRTTCTEAVSGSARVRALLAQAARDWMTEVLAALAHNRTTLALQSMDRLLGPDGTLAALRRMGYRVQGP
jgi:uncharacterized protein YbaP (TraB family)